VDNHQERGDGGTNKNPTDDLASTVDAEGRLEQHIYDVLFNARSATKFRLRCAAIVPRRGGTISIPSLKICLDGLNVYWNNSAHSKDLVRIIDFQITSSAE
jgi:hypothetical protein